MTNPAEPRRLGSSGPAVSALGMGTWAIGGPFFAGPDWGHYPPGQALGWGDVDDTQSAHAIHCALDLGITFFDTADAYGAGHAERVLGRALGARRQDVVIASKFGHVHDQDRRELVATDTSPDYIRRACEASLARLGTDWIDLYQLHCGDLPIDRIAEVAGALDRLCEDGLIRSYGWSTDDPERATAFAARTAGVAIQLQMNVLEDTPEMLAVCRARGLAGIIRSPLATGFLTGKFTADTRLAANDIRCKPPAWLPYFQPGGGATPEWLAVLESLREVLTSGGRTLAQGALAWIWARDPGTIPIPGARSEAQVRDNAGALAKGALEPEQLAEIDRLLGRG